MVESNNGDERLARIEHMLECLQHESAAINKVAADVLEVVVLSSLAAASASSALLVRMGRIAVVCACDTVGMKKKPARPRRSEDAAQSAFRALQHVIELSETANRPESLVPTKRRRKAPASPAKKKKATPTRRSR